MLRWIPLLGFLFTLALPLSAAERFTVLCYHEVSDSRENLSMTGVTAKNLVAQFSWLHAHGYQVISVQDLLDARAGRKSLPENAVLLTFDDGYASFYHLVFPLLKAFDFPAVVAVVGSWLEVEEGGGVRYGNKDVRPRKDFLSWNQIREMMASGLVEIASHSYDLHHGVLGNPQGNLQPAATTRIYDPGRRQYENDPAYRQRNLQDLERNSKLLQQHLGFSPRVMVWPYGAYNMGLLDMAKKLGMEITLTLGDGANTLHNLRAVRRILIQGNPSLEDFVYTLEHVDQTDPLRVVHVDLDYIYDPDPRQTEHNLGRLLDRIKAMKINTVYLQAFADPDGDGNADALYFPNRHMPVRADLFNRVAWQLATRTGVHVYAWMPVLAFATDAPSSWWVRRWKDGGIVSPDNPYHRLSPFNAEVRKWVADIYEDLAKYAHFTGLLFHDDAFLSDSEDFSPAALHFYNQRLNLISAVTDPSFNRETRFLWAQSKEAILTDFTHYLTERVQQYRPEIKTARNLYARVIMQPESRLWFAQTFEGFLKAYDYVAIMAMPYMEKAADPSAWLKKLVERIRHHPGGLRRSVLELQTVDWRRGDKIPAGTLAAQMELLMAHGALNLGYYPDDLYTDHPPLAMVKSVISLQTFPFGP